MDIRWLGDSTFIIESKKSTLLTEPSKQIIDENVKAHNLICLYSNESGQIIQPDDYSILTGPGEYEAGGVSVKGIPTAGKTLDSSTKSINTFFNVDTDGLQTAFFGWPSSTFDDLTIKEIGTVDILIISPSEQLIDSDNILFIIREIEPKVIILSKYQESGNNQNILENLASELGYKDDASTGKITFTRSNLPDSRQIILLDKSN